MRYLTKKWGDGSEYATLVQFTPINKNLRILKVQN
jgi:hypothetical protein